MVEAREAAGSWDHAPQMDAKLLLEVKSSIFKMLKLCKSLRAGMSPPPDTGRPQGQSPTGLSDSPPTQTYQVWVPSASGSAAAHQTRDVLHEKFHYFLKLFIMEMKLISRVLLTTPACQGGRPRRACS